MRLGRCAEVERGKAAALLEEDHCGKGGDRENEHKPFEIVALEPAGEMQNEYYDCDHVEAVKSHALSPWAFSPGVKNKPKRYAITA
jgi:hypothetical protein